MNVTEADLRAYLETFKTHLEESAKKYLPDELQGRLLHLSLMPARITGYVSTQFGVAVEYEPSDKTNIKIVRGSTRIEDLFVNAPSRVRNTGPMFEIGGSGTGIYHGTFSGAFPFRLTTAKASVSFGEVAFEVGQWKRFVHYAEVFGDRSRENWSLEKAVSRAKDEVLAAMVVAAQAKDKQISIADYIKNYKEKTVLVLGDYDNQGLSRLESIARALRELGYEPLLIKDIPDHPYHDLPQKVVAVAAISRFIVVDDSSKSGHLLEVQLCKQNSWVTVLLRAGGQGGSWMTAGASYASNVILEIDYDPESPEKSMTEACTWAENKLKELQVKFENTYPWRTIS